MMKTLVPVKTLAIANGAAVSTSVDTAAMTADADMIGIYSPTMVTAVTSVIEVSLDAATFVALENELGSVVVGPDSAKAVMIPPPPFPYWRVRTNANVGAALTLTVFKITSSS